MKKTIMIACAAMALFLAPVMAAGAQVSVRFASGAQNPVKHGAHVLSDKLNALGYTSDVSEGLTGGTGLIIQIVDISQGGESAAAASEAGLNVAEAPESFAVGESGGKIIGAGRDAVGSMYAAYEIAERLEMNSAAGIFPGSISRISRTPFMEIRAVNPFFHVDAFNDPKSWYYDEEYWKTYLDELSWDRYNLLDIHAMYELISTFFPNCYLYLLKSEKFPQTGASREQAEKNLAMFNKIISMAKDRRIRVSLMSYHASWQLTSADKVQEPNDEDLEQYTKEMVKQIIQKCPDLWMVGFRIGESGRREDFFERSYIAGIKESGRDIFMFTRTWLAAPWQVMKLADAYPGRTFIEIKYNGEQLGLPYHAMTANRTGTAPSYTYENYTDWPRNYKIIWQIRSNGTHRLFRWGDPEFAERTMRTVKFGAGSGFSMEPMTSYYPPTDFFFKPETGFDYFRWDHQRNWFWYMVWGRMAYNPDGTDDVWLNRFRQKYGSAYKDAFDSVTQMSRIVPLIYSWRCLGPDHRNMAPEYETGGSLRDFADNFPLDPQNIHSVSDYVNRLLYNDPMLGTMLDPFKAAGLLDKYADDAEAAITRAAASADSSNKEFQSLKVELYMLAHLARYYSNKIRASAYLEFFTEKSTYPELMWAKKYTADAHSEWDLLSQGGEKYYLQILDTLRIRGQVKKNTFTWRELEPQLKADAEIIADAEKSVQRAAENKSKLKLFHVPVYVAEAGVPMRISATILGGEGELKAIVHYRRPKEEKFRSVEMKQDGTGPSYVGIIPAADAEGEMEYFITAERGSLKDRYPGGGPGRIKAKSFKIEEYADGSARKVKIEHDRRVEFEKKPYVQVIFAKEFTAPVLEPGGVRVTEAGKKAGISVRIADASPMSKVVMYFKPIPSGAQWQTIEVKEKEPGSWYAAVDLTPSGILYYFHAADIYHNAAAYPDFLERTPYLALDSWDPAVNPYAD